MLTRAVLGLAMLLFWVENASPQEKPVVALRRTSCFGTCPVYSLEIFRDGTVRYVGRQFVDVVGKATTKIPPSEVERLVSRFLAINYFDLENSYRMQKNPDGTYTTISDSPTTYTTLRVEGRTKTIADYAFAPRALKDLELEIDRIAGTHRWLHEVDDLKSSNMVLPDVYQLIKPGMTRLMQAAGKGDLDTLRREYESGADVNAQDETGWTALMLAAATCQAKAVHLLLSWRARADLTDSLGDTAMMGAAAASCTNEETEAAQAEIIRTLIAFGANPNIQNHKGQAPLMWVVRYGNVQALRALLDNGALLMLRDDEGKTALDYARAALKKYNNHSWTEDLRQVVRILEGVG